MKKILILMILILLIALIGGVFWYQNIKKENQEVHYLTGKVKSARFFCAHLLPQAMAKAKGILSGDRSALTTPL